MRYHHIHMFQWAPTLGGECCFTMNIFFPQLKAALVFQWAPTLGGECYSRGAAGTDSANSVRCFNGHPPLGVNATCAFPITTACGCSRTFQWAPTLGGECYGIVYLITPPLCQEVNALLNISQRF